MTLTVEDGTGLSNADAFVSVEEADAYHTARGNSAWVSTSSPEDEDKEQAIRRASYFLSNAFSWAGYKVHGRDQSLAWPRYDVVDREGWAVPSDEVPQEIKDACCEVALRELADPGSMNPDVTLASKVKSEQVGPLRVEYANVNTGAEASRPVLLILRDLIGGLLKAGSGSGIVGTAVRS